MKQTSLLPFAIFLAARLAAQTAAPPVAYRVSTFAGVPWSATLPATAPDIMLKAPFGVVFDKSGNLYIANYEMHSVRKIEPNGRSIAIAGDGLDSRIVRAGEPEGFRFRRLTFPRALAVDGDRYLYIGEPIASRIRQLDLQTNELTTIIGGTGGFSEDGTAGVEARLNEVLGLAVDGEGNLLFAETGSHRIRRWRPSTGVIDTIAGTGTAGFSGDGGPALEARLNRPVGLALHPNGDIYFFDFENRRLRRIRGGTITTIAGSPSGTVFQGPGAQVSLGASTGIALDAEGLNVYVTSESTHRVFKVQLSDATVTTAAGTGTPGRPAEGVNATASPLWTPTGITAHPGGGMVVADTNNHRIRRIDTSGMIRTLAGLSRFGLEGSTAPNRAVFDFGVYHLSAGTGPSPIRTAQNGSLLVIERSNCLIRSVVSNAASILVGTAGSCSVPSLQSAAMDNERNVFWADSGSLWYRPASGGAAQRRANVQAFSMTLSNDGVSLTFAQPFSNTVGRVARASVLGAAPVSPTILAGSTQGLTDGAGAAARFNVPLDIAESRSGDIYVADANNRAIRKISGPNATTTTLHRGLSALLSVAVDSSERIWASGIFLAQRVSGDAADVVLGDVSETGFSPDGAANRAVRFGTYVFVTGGPNGTIYLADMLHNVVRQAVPVAIRGVAIVDGNDQTAPAGSGLAAPIRVRVMGADGAPLSGIVVQFTASHLQQPVAIVTDAGGIASLRPDLPGTAGPVTFTATVEGLPAVTVRATAAPPGPVISAIGVDPRYGGGSRISGGSWIEIRGTTLAAESAESAEGAGSLGGARVLFNGAEAMLVSASPTRIVCVVPSGLEGSVTLSVVREGMDPAVRNVQIVARAVALLAPPELRGGGKQFAQALLEGGAVAGPAGLTAASRPAKAGEKVTFTAAGFGAAPSEVKLYFGDKEATVGAVTAGPLGTYTIEVTVPEGVSGELSIGMIVDGALAELDVWTAVE